MRVQSVLCLAVCGVLLGLTSSVAPAQSVQEWLRETGLSSEELSQVDSGEPLVWVPKADNKAEVTLLAVVRIGVTPDDIRGMARDITGLAQRDEQVLQVGVFAGEPSPADAATLRLPDGDIKDLPKCKVGSCAVRFPADALEQMQGMVEGVEQANAYMARWLANYLSEYQARGSEALAVYADKTETQSVAEGLEILMRKTDLLIEYDDDFYGYVSRYPAGDSPGAENLFYWTVEDLSLKPTVFLNHMAIRGPGGGAGALVVIKQIYASHYIQAGFKVYAALPVSDTDPTEGVYVLLTQRMRFDGDVGGLKRKALEDGTTKAARSQLRSFKKQVEAGAGG